MIVTRGQVWTVGGMWKNFPPKLLQLLKSGSCRVESGIVTALAVLPLGNQSVSRGPRRSKNDVSMTLPGLSTARLFFCQGDDGCFHCWLMCLVSMSYYKHQDSSPPTIRAKNSSPSHSYRSRCSLHPCELPSVPRVNTSALMMQNPSETPEFTWWCDAHVPHWCQGCHWYVLNDDHTAPFDPLGTCIRVRNFWWTTGACQVLSAARTLFEPLTPNTSVRCTLVAVRMLRRIHYERLVPTNCMTQRRPWLSSAEQ